MQSAPIDLNHVRRLFARPEKLLEADFFYREIATRMLERLHLVKLDPARVVDAGCGRGADLDVLQNKYPHAQIIGLDSSQELLQVAAKAQADAAKLLCRIVASLFQFKKQRALNLINGDFSQLPLADQSSDLMWSNLALHWHPEPDQVFKEWRRVLKTDGLLMFSVFGPDSLKEIRHAFEEADTFPHALPFVDMHDYGDMLVNAGFATPVMDMETVTLTYSTAEQLLAEVRSFGGNPLQTRARGLMGRAAWQRACAKIEQMRGGDGRIPLTLEIIYGHAFKPIAKQNKSGESIIQFHNLKK